MHVYVHKRPLETAVHRCGVMAVMATSVGFHSMRPYGFCLDTKEDLSYCQAYNVFKKSLQSIRSKYSYLNPTSPNTIDIPDAVCSEFLRGAVTSVLATWECFVDDVLTECFDIVVKYDGPGSDTSSSEGSVSSSDSEAMGTELKKLRKRWPNCQRVIQNSIKRRGTKQNKPLEVVAFEMMLESKPHVSLLMEHRRLVLKGVSPLLLGDGGVEEAFDNLFALTKKGKQPQRSLSAHLASIPMLMEYRYKLASKVEVNLSYSSVKVVNDVLRLYYGVRCVVSHGVAKKTVDEGCLSNFPPLNELEAGLSDKRVAGELWDLYDRVKRDGREVKITYLELCMIYRFFHRLANRLMVAVAMGVHGISKRQPILWKYMTYLQERRGSFVLSPLVLSTPSHSTTQECSKADDELDMELLS